MSTNSEGGWWCSLKSTGVAPESDLWETVSMLKPNPRIVTRGAAIPVLGICEYCNAQFKSNEPLKDDAKAELRAQFDAHKCEQLDASQNPVRIVRESTEKD
jgi:hypothetical protein